ncbi:Nicotinamide riboside kinase, partial [Smittium mucronatum]
MISEISEISTNFKRTGTIASTKETLASTWAFREDGISKKPESNQTLSPSDQPIDAEVQRSFGPLTRQHQLVILVEGILLFANTQLLGIFDARIFLLGSYDTLKHRRGQRSLPGQLESVSDSSGVVIWPDPPGYFDDMVWPNFIRFNSSFLDSVPQPFPPARLASTRYFSKESGGYFPIT